MSKQITPESIDKLAELMIDAANGSHMSQMQAEKILDIFTASDSMGFDEDFVKALQQFIGETVVRKVFKGWLASKAREGK